jgi:ketosteroid isomerase-like protein
MMTDDEQLRAQRKAWRDAVQSRDLERTMAIYHPGLEYLLWTRETIGWRKRDGKRLMIHDPVSVPIDLETGVGVMDFRP